ncbi:OmpA family protein [Sulfurimonas sp.]|uniref:OmpA family protein n=1 Tax=Sulfurimonas sp. TaxID=2022749 RepID=UPI002B49DF6B|nr:OmpA family protein [Sulfurimonas sp.]
MKYLLILIFAYSLFAGTYDDNYKIQQDNKKSKTAELDVFMYDNFQEIIRFKMLNFDEDELEDEMNEDTNTTNLQDITNTIKKYILRGESVSITIIGHTPEASLILPSYIQQKVDTEETIELSKKNAKFIQDALVKDEIKEELMTLSYRGGKDMAFSDSLTEGKELSNRVMVTLYVKFPKDIDSDKDGVFDSIDRCPATPRGAKVDSYGCPIDSDKDGVIDYKDECPKTPIGIEVDKKGCPLDSDGDGVVDYKDRCPDTSKGVSVDPIGCALGKELEIIFKLNSDKILKSSYEKIVTFAVFLKQNPVFNAQIIGHTDSIGKAELNMRLSQRRAATAKSALIYEGIAASRITTKGRGELDPIQSNRTKEGRAKNRRIEVKLSYNAQ